MGEIQSVCLFVRASVRLFVHSFVRPFVPLFFRSFGGTFILSNPRLSLGGPDSFVKGLESPHGGLVSLLAFFPTFLNILNIARLIEVEIMKYFQD